MPRTKKPRGVKYRIKVTRKWNSTKRGDEIPSDAGIPMIFSSSFISRNSLDFRYLLQMNIM
ncbi:hypothetical protein RhiirB3_419976 [Rhizophagus irregularis]|nr:hypothetical protein RhiirB3_419976 [Rhizophagus irregularis]